MTRKWNGDEITILEEDIIVGLAKKYNKTPAQVIFSNLSSELFYGQGPANSEQTVPLEKFRSVGKRKYREFEVTLFDILRF